MSAPGKKLAVIGWPIGHSLSPLIHNHWICDFGFDATYEKVPVKPNDLGTFIKSAGAGGYSGFNITLPHKTAAMAFTDKIDDTAQKIGAINTIEIGAGGAIIGTNTDAAGFLAELRALGPDLRPDRGPVLVLGAGGAARAVVVALQDAGVSEIRIANRTAAHADILVSDLNISGAISVIPVAWCDRGIRSQDASLVVNATSLGLAGGQPLEFDVGVLRPDAVVYDLVYGFEDTPLVARATARGLAAHGGLGMLCRQAALSFQRWFGVLPDVDDELISSLHQHIRDTRD